MSELTVAQRETLAGIEHAPSFACEALWIVPKERKRGLIPFVYNDTQLALHAKLMAQHRAGRPLRAIALKSRQVGVSTAIQGLLIQRATQTGFRSTVVVAHDTETGGKLFGIGHRMYVNLPAELKPEIRSFRRTRFLHFGQRGEAAWMDGGIWPDSTYWVDTAGEFEAGRGGTYHDLHISEYAFFPQPEQKHTALMQAVPDDPDTFVAIESTANGHNHFKELWDDAVEGRSEFAPFFWPWWRQPEYTRPFMVGEREEFRAGDTEQSPYAEEEPELLDPGPIDTDTGEHHSLTPEQLNWRRWTIANKLGGKVEKFHQEYPVSPEQAFLATGHKVFEPMLVARAMARAERTDPRVGQGGPLVGLIEAGAQERRAGERGPVDVPTNPKWKPARNLRPDESPDWRVWLEEKDGAPVVPKEGLYVVGVDVSQGIPESEGTEGDTAYHAIEVIDHRTKEQITEYRSRCDPDLLADFALLTANFFNDAWLAVEITGPGLQVFRRLWRAYRYRFLYFRKTHDRREDKQQDRMGWSTDRATKPVLLAGGQELLREGTHGIKSRRLVSEMQTYIRLSTGKTLPERGKFADLLVAWLIAQQVAQELPLRVSKPKKAAAKPLVPGWVRGRAS